MALKCGRGASPLPCSAVEAERKLQSGLAVDPAGRGCDSHQALQKNEESFSLTRQESNVHHLVDANKKPSDTVFSTAQSLSHVLCDTRTCTPGFSVHHQLQQLAQTHVHRVGYAITISSSVVSFCSQSFSASGFFSNESVIHIRWPKYWSFSFSISPSNEYSGLISFRMDWLDLLAVQGTLKSLLQHHSSNASIRWHSAFFSVQLSHPYTTTGKTTALTRPDLSQQSNISAFEYAI